MKLPRLNKRIVPKPIRKLCLNVVTFLMLNYFRSVYKPLIIRKNTTDISVFRDVFILRALSLPVKIMPKLIIDAGAYTGFSTLYYSSRYPRARIIAIEPEASNFAILEEHTERLSNVMRLRAGLWHKNAFLRILDRKNGKWGFVVTEVSNSEAYDVEAVTISELLEETGFSSIDILKIDIEGSEKEVFSKNRKWIDKVNVIVAELHDGIKDGCTKSFYSAIDRGKWWEYKEFEKVILVRKKFVK